MFAGNNQRRICEKQQRFCPTVGRKPGGTQFADSEPNQRAVLLETTAAQRPAWRGSGSRAGLGTGPQLAAPLGPLLPDHTLPSLDEEAAAAAQPGAAPSPSLASPHPLPSLCEALFNLITAPQLKSSYGLASA